MPEPLQTTPPTVPATTVPPAATTPPAQTTETTATPIEAGWTPFAPDATKTAAENLVLKEAHDAKVPQGHDPNTPLAAKQGYVPPAATTPPPATTPPAAPPAPGALTLESLKVPDGFTVDPALGGELITLISAKAANPAELAQGLIDLQIKAQNQASETASKAWDGVQDEWKALGQKDVEYGARYNEVTSAAKEIATRFGGEKFASALELTGMGNHPEWLRFVDHISPLVKEAKSVTSPTPAAPQPAFSPTNLYPDQGKK